MKIAVIVTTYNRPDTLVRVLDGLIHQSRLPDEILIADDGSGYETREAITPYLDSSAISITHVWQEDKGFRAARIRNMGIKASSSDYMIFLDGDCIPERNFVNDHANIAKSGFFFQGKRVIVSKSTSPDFSFKETESFLTLIKYAITSRISNSHHILRFPFAPSFTTKKLSGIRSCNLGVFREDLIAINGFNQDFTGWGREDSELVVRLYNYGLMRLENPFRAICYHLWHEENSRDKLDENDQLLSETLKSKHYICPNGIKELL